MFAIIRTFSWAALVSTLGYVFVGGPELVLSLVDPENIQAEMVTMRTAFDQMAIEDQVVVQRICLKTDVLKAFKLNEISIEEAASCFLVILTERGKVREVIPPGHEHYSPNLRACLGLLLWLEDPEFKKSHLEFVINDFRDMVNIARNGGYEITLPPPPVRLLAEFIY